MLLHIESGIEVKSGAFCQYIVYMNGILNMILAGLHYVLWSCLELLLEQLFTKKEKQWSNQMKLLYMQLPGKALPAKQL